MKTIDEVIRLAKIAKENGIHFHFSSTPNSNLIWSSDVEINKTMTLEEMYIEIHGLLVQKGINPDFDRLKAFLVDGKSEESDEKAAEIYRNLHSES